MLGCFVLWFILSGGDGAVKNERSPDVTKSKISLQNTHEHVGEGVPDQSSEETRILERASADGQTFATTTSRSKNMSAVGEATVSSEQP